jgi:hypothetical protein
MQSLLQQPQKITVKSQPSLLSNRPETNISKAGVSMDMKQQYITLATELTGQLRVGVGELVGEVIARQNAFLTSQQSSSLITNTLPW